MFGRFHTASPKSSPEFSPAFLCGPPGLVKTRRLLLPKSLNQLKCDIHSKNLSRPVHEVHVTLFIVFTQLVLELIEGPNSTHFILHLA